MSVKNVLELHRKLKDNIDVSITEIEQMRKLTEKVIECSENADRLIVFNKASEMDKKLTAQYDAYIDLHERITDIINTLDNESEKIVLKRFYVLHENIETIARKVKYSTRHVNRLLKSGLEKLQIKYKDIEVESWGVE